MKLSVVMPVYNEERTLEEIVGRVLATPYEKELILVDDGSRDRSREIMELITRLNQEKGITVVMVTHEQDMAAYAHRVIRFVDGRIASDEARKAA